MVLCVCATPLACAETAEAVFQKAAAALASQDYAAAESGFQAVLKVEPRSIPALGNLGVVYSRTRRYAQAIETYKTALRLAPADKGLATNLGLAYIKQEQYGAAVPVFRKLSSDSENTQARELLATCYLSLQENEAALDALAPLLARPAPDSAVLFMAGVARTRLKRPAEAQEAFTRMMRSVSSAQANFLMGKASYETQHLEEAAGFFRQALLADPHLDGAHRELGKTLISLRDDENAAKELRLADPEDAEALYFLGGVLSQSDPAAAIPLLNRAREMNPEFWGAFYYLGRIEVDRGRASEALPLLQRAARLNPEESAVQYQLGRALQKAGRSAEARAAFARVKQLKESSLQKEVDALQPAGKP
jgi:tetratricopeptide (TPR) repeat protein